MMTLNSKVKSTLFCGPAELRKSFMFEVAIYWAGEGQRVVYITPTQLDSLPPGCHDRGNPAATTLKLMRFMYLENYDALIKQLAELHVFAALPSVIVIENLDHYIHDSNVKEEPNIQAAKICAIVFNTMNTIARILRIDVHVVAWYSTETACSALCQFYFQNIYSAREEKEDDSITLRKVTEPRDPDCLIYKYMKLKNGTRVLNQILREIVD